MTGQKIQIDQSLISNYDYTLPESLIAEFPANPRDSAKLLVYNRNEDSITHTTFNKLFDFLDSKTAVLLNNTKVIKARIFGQKISGGKIELLLNSPLQNEKFSVYIRGKVKIDTKLEFDQGLSAQVISLQEDGTRVVSFYHQDKKINTDELFDILDKIGHIPLPPYIKREDNEEDSVEYQTVFSKEKGAVAAPTASLHFTNTMFEELKKQYDTHFLTLHVGAGTFKPVDVEEIKDHIMHSEFYNIPQSTCDIIDSKKPILAVGTTVTRTVEYYVREHQSVGKSNLFLHPKNKPQRVTHLLTNFHLPKSTLIMLVASFIGIEKTLEIYKIAVEKKYRFFSYGDAMLII
nr:tRNA preQ1(34) S-adenosylmethionine ribosyltransferase-isomerase QueA [Sulfurospirillum arcachonense]